MSTVIRFLLLTALFLSTHTAFCNAAKKEPNPFFKKGIKAYSKGKLYKAVENLKLAYIKEPRNETVKRFTIKILLEAASRSYIGKDYSNALKYLEYAAKIDPENSMVKKMNEFTKDLINSDVKIPTVVTNTPFEVIEAILASQEISIEPSDRLTNKNLRATLIWTAASTLLFLIFCILFFAKNFSVKKALKKIESLTKQLTQINEDRNILLNKLMQAKDESTRERIAVMAQNLNEYNPGEALNFLSNMAENPNPIIRSNAVYALAQLATPETIDILFGLNSDPDERVKGEVLKNLKILEEKVGNKDVSIDPVVEHKLKYLLASEKSKSEWIF